MRLPFAWLLVTALAVAAPHPKVDPLAVTQQLQHGMAQVAAGRFAEGIGELREYIDRYPDSVYADYAHYWLAFAHYRKHEYALAEVTTDYLIYRHPESFKIAEARALNALSRWQRGAREKSGEEIKQWLVQHPQSELAPLVEATLFGAAGK